MKNSVFVTAVALGMGLASMTYADEVSLKRSCVKDNPLVAGETDPTLILIYAQICDKKNKDNKNAYLAQAAHRFQQLGQNNKALSLVNSLNASGFHHPSLTDVKFLSGVAIANEALTQMRGSEVRYLSDETYAPAAEFNEAVKKAKPLTVIETKVEEAPPRRVQEYRAPVKSTPKPVTRRTTNNTPKSNPTPRVSTPVEKAPAKRENPFGSL